MLGKDKVTLDMFVDGKSKVVNFYNIFYTLGLEYNFFLISIIEKANYSILAKKREKTVFNNKDNITLEVTRIRASYLVNIFISRKNLASLFILLLK